MADAAGRLQKVLEDETLDIPKEPRRSGRLLAVSLAAANPPHHSRRRRRLRRAIPVGVVICGFVALIVTAVHFLG